MSVAFNAASTNYMMNTAAPILVYPLTFGLWCMPLDAAASFAHLGGVYSQSNSHDFCLYFDPVDTGRVHLNQSADGAASGNTKTTVDLPVGSWCYILARFISATNRRLSVLYPDGSTNHTQNTTSVTPTLTGANFTIGGDGRTTPANTCFTGRIAEFFQANIDIVRGGGVTPDQYLRVLAYRGPFTDLRLKQNIVEYRSFRDDVQDAEEEDVFWSAGKRLQVWANSGALVAPHPPLSRPYPRPGDSYLQLVI